MRNIDILDELRGEHRRLGKILKLLSHQLELLKSDGSPDYILLQDILDYIENYPEFVHHPREDAVFKAFLGRHDELQPIIDNLLVEHEEMKRMTKELREEIDGIARNALVIPKKALEQQLLKYLERQIHHINIEETKVFPVLQQELTADDLQRIVENLPSKEDPLFGEVVQQRYNTLYQHIIRLEREL
jgi:hemerythrin-like domain-containing protein